MTDQLPKTDRSLKQSPITFAVVVLGILIGWSQINYYYAKQRDVKQALTSASATQGKSWCTNQEPISNEDGSTSGINGWPCFDVSTVANLVETNSNGKSQICGDVEISQEIGLPGEQIYQKLPSVHQCSLRVKDVSNFEDDILKRYLLSDFLKQLNKSDCLRLKNDMSAMEAATYCYML